MVLVATQVKRRRGTTAENDAFTGAEGEITVDTEKHELRVHDGVTLGGFKIGGGSGAMPVGAIFTTPRTGTIEGAVEANGNPYNIADYSGDGSIGALLTAGTLSYVSKAEFQTQVTNTGACDSFGWDGADDTTFLVPKLNPWHVGKSAPVIGNGTSPEFVNLDNNTKIGNHLGVYSNQYSGNNVLFLNGTNNNTENVGLTTDPTKSGMIADLSETTNLRVMVQLATGATDQALETCTSVLADVAGLKDMSNVTATGKETVVGWGMPDYSAGVNIAVPTSSSNAFVAQYDCYMQGISARAYYISLKVYLNDVEYLIGQGNNINSAQSNNIYLFLPKGTKVYFTSGYVSASSLYVFPLKGVN